jgi:hypothetical protein
MPPAPGRGGAGRAAGEGGRRDEHLPGLHPGEDVDHLGQRAVLRDERRGAGLRGPDDPVGVAVGGHHGDDGVRRDLADPAGGGQPVLAGHLDVHDHDVGLQLLRHGDRLRRRVRGADRVHPGGGQGPREELGEGAVVVDHQDPRQVGRPLQMGKRHQNPRDIPVPRPAAAGERGHGTRHPLT